MSIEITATITREQLRSIAYDHGDELLDALDIGEVKHHLQCNGYTVHDEDADLSELLEGCDAYEVADWVADSYGSDALLETVNQYCTAEEVLDTLSEDDVVRWCESTQLVGGKELSDYTDIELAAEVQRRMEARAESISALQDGVAELRAEVNRLKGELDNAQQGASVKLSEPVPAFPEEA